MRDGELHLTIPPDQANWCQDQLMIGVFDFPAKAVDGGEPAIPELIVSHVRGRPATTG